MARLVSKVAIVTGAAGGMGRAIASALAAEGTTVVLVDIADEALERATGSLRAAGGTVHAMPADVTSRHDVARLVDGVVERFGRLDVLVNNAGIVTVAPLETYPEEDFDRVLAVNLKGAFLVSQAAGRAMLAAGGGAIVNVASIAGHVPSPGSVAYSASKAALLMLTRQIAVEWGHRGIRCNAVAPGAMSWSMEGHPSSPAALDAAGRIIPLGRVADPDEVGSVVAFLASDDARNVSAQEIGVDGGFRSSLLQMLQREMG